MVFQLAALQGVQVPISLKPIKAPSRAVRRSVRPSYTVLATAVDRAHLDQSSPMAEQQEPVRLTQLSHGGGCGCKIAPAKLQQVQGL